MAAAAIGAGCAEPSSRGSTHRSTSSTASHTQSARRSLTASPIRDGGSDGSHRQFTRKAEDWPKPGRYSRTIKVGGLERRFLVQLPGTRGGFPTLPLLFVLHDDGGSPEQHAHRKGGVTVATAAAGYVTVFPAGALELEGKLGRGWTRQPCGGQELGKLDDVAFVREIIDLLDSELKIDPTRIFVLGFGTGGHLAHRLGAELSSRIAAIVPIAASVGCRETKSAPVKLPAAPGAPVSAMIIHGTADPIVPYEGGPPTDAGAVKRTVAKADIATLPVAESVGFWVKANRCEQKPTDAAAGGFVRTIYRCPSTNTEVVLVTLKGLGHSFPRRLGFAPAMKVINAFFDQHPRK